MKCDIHEGGIEGHCKEKKVWKDIRTNARKGQREGGIEQNEEMLKEFNY